MSVWLTIPSKRPPEECEPILKLWRERGYKISLWVDSVADGEAKKVDFYSASGYPGYAQAVNIVIQDIISDSGVNPDPGAEWFIAAGDDTEPDMNHSAEEIARECEEHFGGSQPLPGVDRNPTYRTFGVMQPTGDRWGDAQGPYIDRVAGSAWIGREFARRVNQGRGPLWPQYFHMGVDEELQAVAQKYGVFWQRPDLTHLHRHWGRPREGERIGMRDRMPKFLERANSQEEWQKYKAIFAARQAAGFPGSELA